MSLCSWTVRANCRSECAWCHSHGGFQFHIFFALPARDHSHGATMQAPCMPHGGRAGAGLRGFCWQPLGLLRIRRPTWWVGSRFLSCVDMGGVPSLSFRFRVEAWPLHHGCTWVASQILFRAGNCTHSSRKEKGPLVGLPLSTTGVCYERCPIRGPWDLGRAALDRVDLAGCRNRPLAGP